MTRRPSAWLAAALVLGGCTPREDPRSATLSVYAAASLTEAFTELGATFEEAHPDVDVRLTFAGSQVLRVQIEEGAPADVFASANVEHMKALVAEGLAADSRRFAGNELVVVVPLDDPAAIDSFEDLPHAERIVLGTPAVPVGRYARAVLAAADSLVRPGFAADVMAHVVSEESNVRLARSKVELGEADASIVYRTDALASDRVRVVPIPAAVNVEADYVIGTVVHRDGQRPGVQSEMVREWDELLFSPEGRRVLERYGFVVR